ncbi:MAG TPA: hypothetical protein PLM07_21210 [Candidatus Rifleibacterium sp.]|nr:hypothetical protein [Candidatus Rifleibacterium sp.]HPT48412.1 hypothetical protein [Candidatus Rifleibacterium sp.]
MSPVYNTIRKVSFRCLLVLVAFMVASLQAGFASPADFSYNDIEVRRVEAPANFENAVRYTITYWYKDNDSRMQVFPTREERERDADLILAQAVSLYLDEEYTQQGKGMDEHVVEAVNMGQVLDLVNKDYLSAAWSEENVNNLRQFMHKYEKDLVLFTINIYLDYVNKTGFYSGNDINPIIMNFKNDGKSADEVTFIAVNYSDK